VRSSERRAAKVERLKKRVPANCTDVAHQSMRHGAHRRIRQVPGRRGSAPAAWGAAAASTASRNWRNAAVVKNSEPTK
jgi:hypothetical protein